MKLRVVLICFSAFLFIASKTQAQIGTKRDCWFQDTTYKILKIIEEQPDAIEDWVDDRIYINPHKIVVTHSGAFLHQRGSSLPLPAFSLDQNGVFIVCQTADVNREAQDHYGKAREALIDALGHSAAAGATIVEVPPVGIYEGYRAVESWKEAAREYNAGVECEQRGTYTPPEPKSSRDD